MRKIALALALMVIGSSAQAATVVILTDPTTLERQTIVVDRKGPDRVLMCMAPPASSGCTELPVRRAPSARR
ncbi:hypothetical protein G7077_10815 [Sphingomonas piscis]|uniref:Uncharacterized protein n=1 Tax=Sphingomonas piscis TaxID=2714943 RepID=A0A6G7YRF3_9SPHN|nr:hypothetical protein [Sphingomonas piscis]QIK79320.1 hypothetical protein G7077_10815 [Sphingomonas piscis]